MRRALALLVVVLARLAPSPAFAQSAAAIDASPKHEIDDIGFTQSAVARLGYTSGVHVGAAISPSLRARSDSGTFGFDPMEFAFVAGVDRPEIGFRLSLFDLVFPIPYALGRSHNTMWQGPYARWNLLEIGFDANIAHANPGDGHFAFTTSAAFGYSVEVSNAMAIRIFEIGAFGGGYTKGQEADGNTRVIFDWGGTLSAGIVIR